MKYYLVNGLVCLEHELKVCDIEVTEGKISAIGINLLKDTEAEIVDLKGNTVIPGIVDFNTHIDEKIGLYNLAENYSLGSQLAILNGITTINSFITQGFNQSLTQAISTAAHKAENNTFCDYRWHLTPTRFSEINYNDIFKWIEKGFSTFKFYTTYKQLNLYLPYEKILEIVRRLKRYDPQFLIHCEDEAVMSSAKTKMENHKNPFSHTILRSEECENTSVDKIIDICKLTQTYIHIVHVSTSDSLGQIQLSKRECPITSEVTPQYIFYNSDILQCDKGYRFVTTPPLRDETCRNYMELKLAMGYPDIIASNHKAYLKIDKDNFKEDYRSVPSGLPAMGAILPLFYDLLIKKHGWDLPRLMQKLATNPARMAKIYPQKGAIVKGADADFVVFNPNGTSQKIISSLADVYNPWESFSTHINIKSVYLRGQKVVENGKILNPEVPSGKPLCITS